jgi:hypothetical protein
MRKEGLQRDPIIVDMESMVVLDGMHRLEALKHLGLTHAVCSLVVYNGEGVRLLRWSRSIKNPSNSLVSRLRVELRMSRRVDVAEGLRLLESGKVPSSLVLNGAALVCDSQGAGVSAIGFVKKFDRIIAEEQVDTDFVDEPSLTQALKERNRAVLLTAKLEKRQVIEAAKKAELFPHKTTMHLLEVRPMGVNFPITKLRGPADPSILERMLSGREKKIIEPPTNHMGRVYADKLVVLS